MVVWLVVTIAVIAAIAVIARRRTSIRSTRDADPPAAVPEPVDAPIPLGPPRRAAIIVNPTKFDNVESVRETLTQVCQRSGWEEPLWLETSAEDPGTGQAEEAVREGVDLVCPLGGDGTVRAVAAALVDTTTPLGLLPGGTGNLLARNLDLPVDSLEEAMLIALNGQDRRIDVGTVNVTVPNETQTKPKDYIFLIVAGIGFDAEVMADAPEELKAQVGWAAYVVSGMKKLNGRRFGVDLRVDDGPVEHRRVRTLMVGNCGRLQGGVELLPDAELDDGLLDTVILAPQGVVGWAAVTARIVTKTRSGHKRVAHRQCRTIDLFLDSGQELQLDGDPIGPAHVLKFAVRPASLTVRVG
ncbi:MAG: diacylglycerol kinase family lipid kinase [Austwickia sp.]|nr:diacylglycerol kinase family lipid kinase [Austwickia sp.]MBK8437091.1 diacylglycerol kinase family lipid kinase [Austwickia sp.]MBK9102326.1 diacylglycerol kinase family lipid kinase [Austwickia sp.]